MKLKIGSPVRARSTTFVVALLSILVHCANAAEHHEQVQDGCRDSLHHYCNSIADNDDCDVLAKGGEIYGETFCRASCGRCDVVANSITTDAECYSFGQQEITLSFSNLVPANDDWIGIYNDSEDDEDLGDLVTWYWLCGNKRDRCKVGVGSVTVPWLPPGTYRAAMARNGNHTKGPSSKHDKDARFAQSSMFEVVRGTACASRRVEDVGVVAGVIDTTKALKKNVNLRRRTN
jgi:hypothetical protein